MNIGRLLLLMLLLFWAPLNIGGSDEAVFLAKPHQQYGMDLQEGMFLIAGREMPDPRFRKSVILIVKHSDMGSMGLVINKRSDIPLSKILTDLENKTSENHILYYGGPVQMNVIQLLFRRTSQLEDTEHLLDDVFLTAMRARLEQLLSEDIDPKNWRVFFGYAGWSPGQLANELIRGDWYLYPASQMNIFDQEPDMVWPQLIDLVSPPGKMVQRPVVMGEL